MEINNPKFKVEKEDDFDIAGLLLSFLSHWKWFVIGVAVCVVLAVFKIVTTVPVYNMESAIYLNDDNTNSRNAFNLNDAANPMVAFKNYIDETEIEVLKSRNNLKKIVDSLKLTYTYTEKGLFRSKPLYRKNPVGASMDSASLAGLKAPIFIEVKSKDDNKFDISVETEFEENTEEKDFKDQTLPFSFDLSYGKVNLYLNPTDTLDGTEKIVIVSPKAAAKDLSERFNIEFAKNSEKIISVSFLTNSQQEGTDVIKALVDFYNKDIIEEKNQSAVQTEAFILDRLIMISNELKDVEDRLKEYREAHNVTNLLEQSRLNLTLKSDYELKKTEIEAQMRILEEIEKEVSKANSYETLPALINNNETMAQIIEDYNKKVNKLNRALMGGTADNPLVRTMQEELNRDKIRVLQNIKTSKESLSTERNSIRALENQSASQLASTPSVDKGFNEIFREQQVKVSIYTFLLQRREEIALQKTLATNTARLIDDPNGEYPVSPRKLLLLAAAILLGLIIPASIIFVRRILFPVFGDKEELERLTKVPVLGEICNSDDKEHREIVIGKNVSSAIAELFRLLRNNIAFTRAGQDSRVILITSSISGEGKTFITSNLAMTYALMGKKVVVVGLDLRSPMLAHSFGLSNNEGVTTYLTGQQEDLNKLIKKTDYSSNLSVLPAGPVPPNPNELLMSDRMKHMIETLREEYDYVLLDTAPIGLISDTFLITRFSDLQLYVSRANYTSKKCLRELDSAIASGKFSSVYIVLNGVDMAAGSYTYRRYGAYGGYGKKNAPYGYGYGKKN
ncbi:MAG: polysaccharide biosynthesis tyrosine autokinase [Muribaculaceae bacterium]|nr:polysaccharide biosynthesis tyrosine autokinase [Muribaculaceae bacterium]